MEQILIVLGGGVDKTGNMPPWVHARLDKTLQEWQSDRYSYVITSGKGRENIPIAEATAMASFLSRNGVPEDKLLVETDSATTMENAYFCRTQYVEQLGIKRLTIVTNQFHIKRSETIFKFVFGADYTISIAASDDTGLSTEVHDLLTEADAEASDFLEEHVFNKLQAGNLDQINSFNSDKDDAGYKAWISYKANSEVYQKVTRLMT